MGTSIGNNMLESQLRNYFNAQMRNGYSADMISRMLISNGFDAAAVSKVAGEFGGANINVNHKHEVRFSHGTILGIVLIIFVAGGIFAFFNLGLFEQKESLLDVSVQTNAYSYLSGQNVNYQMQIMNMGSDNRFDAIIKSVIIDDAGNIITRKEETIAVETTSSVNRNIQIPANTPGGKYYLKVIADYDGKQATSTSEFEVIKGISGGTGSGSTANSGAGQGSGNQQNQGTGGIGSGGFSSDGIGSGSISSPNAIASSEFNLMISEIKILSKTNPQSASAQCAQIESRAQRDICYETIADASGFTAYCAYIEDAIKRDNCYVIFVLKGNADVCPNIADENSRAFCDQLKIMQLMDKYYAENDTEKILELSKQLNPDIYTNSPVVTIPQYTYTETATITIVDVIDESGSQSGPQGESDNSSDNSTNSTQAI